MSDKSTVYELKETAKWSHNAEEKKAAIKELSTRGPSAIPQLEEILSITAYEEIRLACAEAIRAIGETRTIDTSESIAAASNLESTTEISTPKNQKKEQKQGEDTSEVGIRLADLPP